MKKPPATQTIQSSIHGNYTPLKTMPDSIEVTLSVENNATKRKPKHLLTSAEQEVNSFDRAI